MGARERYVSEFPGMNTRLDEIQAAILRVKLPYLDKENSMRRELASIYDAALSGTSVIPLRSQRGVDHAYHQYVVRSERRDELRAFLKANSIGTLIHYPVPVHLQPAYQGRVILDEAGLAQTEAICRRILSLPMHPHLTNVQAQEVGDLIARWHR
jgi:dTDP-4-amino-4,6-dideoxygalactose transaminase